MLTHQDFETWSVTHKHYLPSEYHSLYNSIEKHCEKFHKMPSIDDLKLEIRDSATREKLYAVEAVKVDAEAYMLLQYLKNEYTQKEILNSLEDYVEHSISFEDAQESVDHLHQIVLDIEDRVDLEDPQESMQRIDLFETEEEIANYIPLGLNEEYDHETKFSPRDFVLVGGKRGAGKSVICANIANNVVASGKSAMYFTIEMDSRDILQRCCSIATNVPFSRLRTKNLSVTEWERVASWWSNRFVAGQDRLKEYKEHRDFEKFHAKLKTGELLPTQQLDVIYDPSLTLARIRAELDKKVKPLNVGVIIVDYINQVKRSSLPGKQYDWTEQIEVSKALKSMAQEYDCTVLSPYQTDASGEARFAKGILDAADAAYAIETYDHEDSCMTFNCVKMRRGSMTSFTSTVDWESLKIGPNNALTPQQKEDSTHKTGEDINDI